MDVIKRFIKSKKLQRLGNSFVLIIPKMWIKSLKWDKGTYLLVAFHPDEEKIIIKPDKEIKNENIKNEEISELIIE